MCCRDFILRSESVIPVNEVSIDLPWFRSQHDGSGTEDSNNR